jgi:hypothetical protein
MTTKHPDNRRNAGKRTELRRASQQVARKLVTEAAHVMASERTWLEI